MAKEWGLVEQTLRHGGKAAAKGTPNGVGNRRMTPEERKLPRLQAEGGRLKRALDEMGVRLPALNSIVLTGFEGASGLRSTRVMRQNPAAPLAEVVQKNARKTRSTAPKDPS
ncbi:MAG: hypothetical protein J5X22_21345 [Candidatus Accumulibacter sp.]|uniref:hypothetical protein n=1 Tax=Accumulibacter sp. TaxID=2053492 RepID=UPI001B09E445|nr:hypothetical protein [Accumulibacter sp.]MBO3712932.1 hypothetical protein [Accumulibacter sp.]